MDQKRKKQLLTIGSILIVVIFLSSYASFANNNIGQTTSTTTISNVQTYFVSAEAINAIVSNYSSSLNIVLTNASQNSSTYDMISSVLGNLQSNGSVLNYFYNLGRYQVYLGSGIDAYGMQSLLNKTVDNKNFKVEAITYVTLPNPLKLYYQGTAVNVFVGEKQYSVSIAPLKSINSTINVTVQALITANGTLYQNNLRVNYTS